MKYQKLSYLYWEQFSKTSKITTINDHILAWPGSVAYPNLSEADAQDLPNEGLFPPVELENLGAAEDLVHQLKSIKYLCM